MEDFPMLSEGLEGETMVQPVRAAAMAGVQRDFSQMRLDVEWQFSNAFRQLDLARRVAMIRREIHSRIVFTTSFGIEDQAIVDAIFMQDLEIDVVTLDTGRLFPETYQLWARTEDRYSRRIRALYPERETLEALVDRQGVNGFRSSVEARHACCALRKVGPLGRALAGAAAWITGLRADQSRNRASASFASVEHRYQLIKVNPLLDWTRDHVVAYVRDRDIPISPLHGRGFLSIGCAPCTRAVAPGEPERVGRWWWEQDGKRECGLHADHPALAGPRSSAQLHLTKGSTP
jgi:phosphoadenosine phosphosulfate reductase